MKNAHWLLVFLFIGNFVTTHGQKTCESPKNSLEDINSIKKCAVKTLTKKDLLETRQITVRVTASKRRFLKKRKAEIAYSINDISSHDISKTSKSFNPVDINIIKAIENKEENSINKFSTVDKIPLFKSCKKTKKEEQSKCFNEAMMGFINNNIKYPDDAINKGIIGKISAKFIIDEKGKANNIEISGTRDSRVLKKEVMRLITKLPKFIPAEKNGKATSVEYEFKLNFSL